MQTTTQLADWIGKLEAVFLKFSNTSPEARGDSLEFIRHQRVLLDVTTRSLSGKVNFTGAPRRR